ncbi:response regulator transcription factor [Cohnella caldifontis]|uniref:response regulator transcription factor n=1 Tax=Cohnella caldifontis TaxID=3027471 RepID=UPI0023EC9B7A|nr:helix-turn-helix domain-containing protein [Cohnella sp. YIM B05605]
MYNLLIVDDEEVAIRGIAHGIDWSSLPIADIHSAYDAEEARQIFQDHPVHILISDIDMPKENGIELLEWVNDHFPNTETIFLTGHADFKFAQQAVRLGSFDYLLKPIDHAVLKDRVAKAIDAIREREEEEVYRKTYEYYHDQWHRQVPLLVERFWLDVLHLRIAAVPRELEPMYRLYGIGLGTGDPVLPLLISIEEWKQDWNARDEEIMTYALKNAAAELLLKDQPGHVVHDPSGMLFALLYRPEAETPERLTARCEEFVRKCSEYLHAVVSCYIGEPIRVGALRTAMDSLADMERSNVGKMGKVFRLAAFDRERKTTAAAPNLQEWAALLEQGKKAELRRRIELTFDRLRAERVDHAFMVNYYFGLVHVVFQLLQRRSISPEVVYPGREWRDGEHALKSLGAMRAWTTAFTDAAAEHLQSHSNEASNTIVRVKQFIERHLKTDLNREAIAAHVYLNPAYLSRLFRKETGQSLTDYTVELRIEKAKRELAKTNVKISDIAISVGYWNFSHFSKLFKKLTGLTPQEYRKRYQDI